MKLICESIAPKDKLVTRAKIKNLGQDGAQARPKSIAEICRMSKPGNSAERPVSSISQT
jgi:hypothetical protein